MLVFGNMGVKLDSYIINASTTAARRELWGTVSFALSKSL